MLRSCCTIFTRECFVHRLQVGEGADMVPVALVFYGEEAASLFGFVEEGQIGRSALGYTIENPGWLMRMLGNMWVPVWPCERTARPSGRMS